MDTTRKKRGKPFAIGNRSGKGRPVGSRNKVTLALEQLLAGDGKKILRKVDPGGFERRADVHAFVRGTIVAPPPGAVAATGAARD